MTADALVVNINANINHSKQRSVITSIPWLILKKPTQVAWTHLEEEFDRQTDSEHPQKLRTITTPAVAVMVFFPTFARNAPRRIGSTRVGWFFGVGRVAAPNGRCRSLIRLTINLLTAYRQFADLSLDPSI
jgi:hypothetical protein